ncbi:MAG TPA: PQQ-dependent dehydrogenase, methanol/ethanol family [Vicinamibacterales bacterium]|nr:PQQ-dependent dehydrogenase, methanol/ethanol family [Vicinamibacterales bacterium]
MRVTMLRFVRIVLVVGTVGTVALTAQQPPPPLVTAQEILDGLTPDGSRWLTFGGNYSNHRHSPLTEITPANVHQLTPQWTFQTATIGNFETTTLLRDNILYVTGPQNVAWALDARTGRQIWRYRRELPTVGLTACCGLVNRGFGVLGDKLFMTTLDAHLLALDMKTGSIVWDATLEDYKIGYASTIAPLVVKDKVIVGVAGGEFGIRGFIDAYEAQTGKRAWRTFTIPGPGEPGNDTWAGDSWKTGGAGVWVTGAYDPEQNLVFFGTGNPGPDYHSESRKGDNLYSASVIALDGDTGRLRWHYQFTPHDVHDWDSTEVPILADITVAGQMRKVLMFANRNGFYYTLDRTNGKVIAAKPFVTTTWAKEIGRDGRPIMLPGHTPDENGELTCPDITGGTNFWPPAFDPATSTFFVNAREVCATFYAWKPEFTPGERFTGGAAQRAQGPDSPVYGALRAIDPATAERKWEFRYISPSTAGLLTTASGLIFSGDGEGNLLALDSRSGKLLWHYQMGATMHGTSPITYMLDGRQHVLVPAGTTLTAWALPR